MNPTAGSNITLYPSYQAIHTLTIETSTAVISQTSGRTQFSLSATLSIDNVSANGSENGTYVLAVCSDDAEGHVRFSELLSHARRRTPRPFEQMPKMQMKSVLKSSQMEMLSKKMSALPKYAKMNRSEVRLCFLLSLRVAAHSDRNDDDASDVFLVGHSESGRGALFRSLPGGGRGGIQLVRVVGKR